MKNLSTLLCLLCLSGFGTAQNASSYLLLQGERLAPNEISLSRVKDICALEVGNDDWQMKVKPTSIKISIGTPTGKATTFNCRGGVADAAGTKALEKVKPGDMLFVCEAGVPERVKAQVGQFALKVK